MPGYVHMYAKHVNDSKRFSTAVRFETNISRKSYLPNLQEVDPFKVLQPRHNAQLFGRNLCEGNLGTLTVYPCEERYRISRVIYASLFSQDLIEFSMTPNIKIEPTTSTDFVQDQLTQISFRQFDFYKQQYHDVTLSTQSTSFNFKLDIKPVPQQIDVAEWNWFYQSKHYRVDVTETYFDMNDEEFIEQLFKEAPEKNRAKTSVIEAYKPLKMVEDYAAAYYQDLAKMP